MPAWMASATRAAPATRMSATTESGAQASVSRNAESVAANSVNMDQNTPLSQFMRHGRRNGRPAAVLESTRERQLCAVWTSRSIAGRRPARLLGHRDEKFHSQILHLVERPNLRYAVVDLALRR